MLLTLNEQLLRNNGNKLPFEKLNDPCYIENADINAA